MVRLLSVGVEYLAAVDFKHGALITNSASAVQRCVFMKTVVCSRKEQFQQIFNVGMLLVRVFTSFHLDVCMNSPFYTFS